MKVLAVVRDQGLLGELRRKGAEVLTAESLESATEALKGDEQPVCVLVDDRLEFAQELIIAVKADVDGPDRDRMPVVVVEAAQTGNGNGNGVRCVPDLRFGQVAAQDVLAAARALVQRRARQRRLFDQEIVLDVKTTPEGIEQTGDLFDRLIAMCGYTDEEQVKIGHSFREAIGNAAEHGNKKDPSKTIRVNFLRSADRFAVVIKDEGPGFDTQKFLARADEVSALEHTRSRRANEVRPGGLGVFIMKQTCDSIRFNDCGNAIYLMKYLPGHAPPSGIKS